MHITGGTGPGVLERLLAPSAYATGGVTLGGASFGTTATGVLWRARTASVAARSGVYAVSLPAASAALLTLPPRR